MVINGKYIAEQLLESLKVEVARLGYQPIFSDVLVGEDPVSLSYVKIKERTARLLGLDFYLAQYPLDIAEDELVSRIHELNKMLRLCGLIVQLPLPPRLNRQRVLDAITPELDVDCIGSVNSKRFYAGDESVLIPPTAGAIIHLLTSLNHHVDYGRMNMLVVGQGDLVGKPVTNLLQNAGARVSVISGPVPNLGEYTRTADVIISGTGKPGLITGDMVKEGVIVIDAGTAESEGGIAGDVDFNSVAPKAAYLSPVPGGVGPVTVAKLLENVVAQAKRRLTS